MGTSRRRFSREFKLEAVRMVAGGHHSLAQVARELDLRPDMLRRWKLAQGSISFLGILTSRTSSRHDSRRTTERR